MPVRLAPYDRKAAVLYAHRWAYHRNPAFYNFDELGGDCTNFASQCLYAGAGVMDYTPTFGWYYNSQYSRAPAWTGVPFFYNFLTRRKETPGPLGEETGLTGLLPGDFVQQPALHHAAAPIHYKHPVPTKPADFLPGLLLCALAKNHFRGRIECKALHILFLLLSVRPHILSSL